MNGKRNASATVDEDIESMVMFPELHSEVRKIFLAAVCGKTDKSPGCEHKHASLKIIDQKISFVLILESMKKEGLETEYEINSFPESKIWE